LLGFTGALAAATAKASNESVEGGREKEAEAGDAQHPEQHCRAERLAHFRTGTSGNGEGYYAQNERERGHQNWAKPRVCGVHRGLAGGDTALFFLVRELDDQNGVLGGQADQNDKARCQKSPICGDYFSAILAAIFAGTPARLLNFCAVNLAYQPAASPPELLFYERDRTIHVAGRPAALSLVRYRFRALVSSRCEPLGGDALDEKCP
jgi:hypothetical protein